MAHYNLYDSLNLETSSSSEEIASELDVRIQEGNLDNLGGIEEVKLAKQILGDPEKRAKYDERLADASAPDITVDKIRELAALSSGAANSNVHSGVQNGANAQGQGGARGRGFNSQISPEKIAAVKSSFNSAAAGASDRARDVQAEYKKSSRTAIVITAVGAFVAGGLIVGLAGSMLGGGGVGSSGVDYNGAQKFADSFLELRQAEETREWVVENADASMRSGMLDRLGIANNGNYAGMDAYFGNTEIASGKPISMTEFVRSAHDSAGDFADEYSDSGVDNAAQIMDDSALSSIFGGSSMNFDPDNQYFVVPIIGNGEYADGTLSVVKDGNDFVLHNFSFG